MLSVSLGHETVAVIAVVSAFFIGLTVGALALGRAIRKSLHPHLWFVALEWTIALWAVVLVFVVPAYNQWMPGLIGAEPSVLQHWMVAFTGSFVLLLPATAAMGATLPAMERVMARLWRKPDRVAGLYACNTLGAVLGTLAATFYLMPELGLTSTLLFFAAVNVVCGSGVWLLCGSRFKALVVPAAFLPATATAAADKSLSHISATRLAMTFFMTGLLGIGYEILVIRVLSQILENTIYTFAIVLSVYLLGTALGSAMYQRSWARKATNAQQWGRRLDLLIAATSSACLLGMLALWLGNTVYTNVWQGLGRGFVPALLGEFGVAALAFLIPTMAMGALFSHLALRATQSIGLGVALGLNTFGAALAPIAFGVAILPLIGAKVAILTIGVGYLLLLCPTLSSVKGWALLPASAALLLLVSPLHLRVVDIADGDRVVDYREGVMATLAVVEDANQHRHLKVNNHFTMGGTASRYSDHRQTHIPLLLHGAARSVLYLGVGTGVTLDAARYHRQTQVVGVELIPESLELTPHFGVNFGSHQWYKSPKMVAADARRYVISAEQKFDVIIGEIFHPARDGAGSLYTQEHFTAVKNRLADGGSFCQWLPLFQLDLPSLQTIVRTFVQVFPSARLHLGHYSLQQPILCLEGSVQEQLYPPDWLLNRVPDPALQDQLVQLRLNSDFALLGGYLASREELLQFAGIGPLNTDDHPLVTFQAPMLAYADDEPPIVRLATIIRRFAESRTTIVAGEFAPRMEQYWRARDRFMLAAVDMEQTAPENWDKTLQHHLLEVVKISGDFEPAYYTLLMMAQEIYNRDPNASRTILEDLHAASPSHPEALALRNRLFGKREAAR